MKKYRRLIFVILICLLSFSALIKWNIIRDTASVVSIGRASITGTDNNVDEDFNRNIANILNILQTIQQDSNCNHNQSAVDSGIKFLTTLKNKEIMNFEAHENLNLQNLISSTRIHTFTQTKCGEQISRTGGIISIRGQCTLGRYVERP